MFIINVVSIYLSANGNCEGACSNISWGSYRLNCSGGGGVSQVGEKAQKCEDTVASVNYSSSSKVKLQTKSGLIDIWLGF